MLELLVRKLERFEPLSQEERGAIMALPARPRTYARGEIVIQQGSRPDESALLVEGFAVRFKVLANGARKIVSAQVPGDFVDLHSLVLQPIDHSVLSASPTKFARVSHGALRKLIAGYPRIALGLMWDIALDGAIAREWLATHGRCTAYEQLGHFFCEMYLRLDWAGLVENGATNFALTQAEIGDACGLSTVHVNRSLQSLRRDGLIVLEGQRLTVPNLDALMQAAGFERDYLHLLR